MKLIIEKTGDVIYAYRENEKHHKKLNRPKSNLMNHSELDRECNISDYDDFVMVFDLKEQRPKRNRNRN